MTLNEACQEFQRTLTFIDPLALIALGWLLGFLTAAGLIAIGIWKGEIP